MPAPRQPKRLAQTLKPHKVIIYGYPELLRMEQLDLLYSKRTMAYTKDLAVLSVVILLRRGKQVLDHFFETLMMNTVFPWRLPPSESRVLSMATGIRAPLGIALR